MSERSRPCALAVVLVAAALGVAGCTDDPAKPKPLPSPTSSSAAPSPSESAPTMPPAAKGTSAASAEAFARHYVDLINYAIRSGETAPMHESSQRSCSGCLSIAEAVDDVYSKSGRVKGGAWVVREVTGISGGRRNRTVQMRIHIGRQTVYDRPSASPSSSVPNNGRLVIHLTQASGGWTVRELDALP